MKDKLFIIIRLNLLLLLISGCSVIHKDYYENGNIKAEYSIRNGKFVGKFKAYYDNGKLNSKGEYNNGKMVGIWHYYYSTGSRQSIQKYSKGRIISIDFWDENGNQTINNGTGFAKHYNSDGILESIFYYKDNTLNGKCETWFPNGIKATEQYYDKGKPTGIWSYWDINGKMIKTERY